MCHFASVCAVAQVDTGQLSGTITDVTGAVIPNAKIVLVNTATGLVRTLLSGNSGEFTFSGLPVGSYKTSVTAAGFSTYQTDLTISVGSRATLDAKLSTGATDTVVEVAAQDESTQVNTTTSEISQVITPKQVVDLPSLTRNPYDFVSLSGNVGTDPNNTADRGAGGANINGQRSAGTEILLDGVENADNYDATVGTQIPLDSVQEYRIITNGFDAQYGRAGGGVVNLITKGGTNSLHGSLYEFNRVSDLAANTYYEDAQNYANRAAGLPNNPADHFTRNQFGYSVGGPIRKDKLFFFSNTEWVRIRSTGTLNYLVPTPSFIASTAANTQAYFASAGALSPASRVVGTVPVPGFAADPLEQVTTSAAVDAGAGAPLNQWFTVNRFDYQATQKLQLSFRAANLNDAYQPGYVSVSPYAGFNTGQTNFNQAYLFTANYLITPNLTSSSKASFARVNISQPINGAPVPSLYLNANNTASTYNSLNVALPGYLPTSPGDALPFGGPANSYLFYQDMAWTKKAHTIHFGGSFIQLRDNRLFGAYENAVEVAAKNGTTTAVALANLQAGTAYSFEVAVDPQGKLPCIYNADGSVNANAACSLTLPASSPSFVRNNTFNDGNWYVQDQWKVNPRVTFTYGLRWEYYGVQHNHNPNLESNFYLGTGNNLAQQVASGQVATTPNSPVGGLVKKNLNNYAPRIGVAVDPFGDGKWALRAGYGISYERNFGNVTYNVIQNPPNYAGVTITNTQTGGVNGTSLPLYASNFGPFAGATGSVPLVSPSLRAVQQNIPTAYTQQYSASIEHEVAPNDLLAVEYSGAHGVHQYAIANLNGLGYGPLAGETGLGTYNSGRINHQYGAINYREANGTSHYDAANVRLNANNLQRLGLQMSVNYTFSHALDTLSSTFSESNDNFNLGYTNPYNPGLDYGNADYDVRQRVSIGGIYQPTFLEFKGNRYAHAIAGGLEFAPIAILRSGTPLHHLRLHQCS